MTEVDRLTVVAARRYDGPASWEVLAGPDGAGGLATVVRRWTGQGSAVGGFGGPPMRPGGLVNWWCGPIGGAPDFLVVRTLPKVQRVSAFGPAGVVIGVPLGDAARFGLRFGAAPIPHGLRLVKLKVALADGTLAEIVVPRASAAGAAD